MIFRKPYAFLIKHFRLIHLIISVLIAFLISKTSRVYNFFKDYLGNNIFEVNTSDYISFISYLSILLIVLLASIIIILMRKKDKPLMFYIVTIIIYSAIFIGFSYVGSIVSSLEFETVDRKTIGLARDISRFMLYGQVIVLIFYIIRTLGFDIKKFDFKKDLHELNITEEDSEEFELVSPVDSDKVKRIGRKQLRNLKYYYLENKLFILIILGVIIVFSGVKIYKNIDFSVLKKYDEKEEIWLDNFYTLSINDSYIVTKNDNGKVIAKNDDFFLIVKFTVNSHYNGNFTLDTNKFIVKISGKEFLATRNYYSNFSSYGVGYKSQRFYMNDSKSYILVYNIDNKYKDKKMMLEYNYRYDETGNGEMIKKVIKLEPEIKK